MVGDAAHSMQLATQTYGSDLYVRKRSLQTHDVWT